MYIIVNRYNESDKVLKYIKIQNVAYFDDTWTFEVLMDSFYEKIYDWFDKC